MKKKIDIDIVSLLNRGKENAVTSAELAELTGLDLRTVRGLIEDARNTGVLIAASNDGYFIPATEQEAAMWLKMAGNKARSIFRTMQGARRWLKIQGWYLPSGQLSFDDLELMVSECIDESSGVQECGNT